MPRLPARALLGHLCQLVGAQLDDRTDRELLRSFLCRREESAFAVLLQRHAPLVWRVCRRALGHQQDAEDAFQAAFLVLAQKAASIRNTETVGGWLHGVACRTAMNAKRSQMRRQRHEELAAQSRPDRVSALPQAETALHEMQVLLDEEVDRLPVKCRAPFVLCCLEGRSRAEAARELGWKEGTVSSRLAQAREQLRRRLARCGVTLSAALTAGALWSQSASACVRAALMQLTLETALLMATGQAVAGVAAPPVAALVDAGIKAMAGSKTKIVVALLLAMSLVSGVGLALGSRQQIQSQAAAAQSKANSQTAATDVYDDPLPPGALVRLGSSQLRHPHFVDWAFAPDHKTLLTIGDLRDLRSWDVTTGKLLETRKLPGGPGASLSLSPDGQLLVGYIDGKFIIWELESGKQLAELSAPGRQWGYVYLSPDSRILVANLDRLPFTNVPLWDCKSSMRT